MTCFRLRTTEHGECAQWAADTSDAVAAEVAAALGTSVAMGHSNLRYARAMHERLLAVAGAFRAGDIDFRLFRTLVFRTSIPTHLPPWTPNWRSRRRAGRR